LARLSADGVVDRSFGTDGSFVLDIAGGLDRLFALEVDSLGRIVAIGQSDSATDRDLLLLRYWP